MKDKSPSTTFFMEPDFLLKMPFMQRMSTLGHTFRNFDQTIITVRVGKRENAESFSCHRELLTRCSPYFERHFQQQGSSPYKNGDRTLELEDTSADIFDAFMIWLYTGSVPHHLIEGGKEVYPPTTTLNFAEANGAPTPPKSEADEDIDTAAWGVSLENEDTVVVEGQADGKPSTNTDAEKPTPGPDPEKEVSQAPALPSRNVEKPEIPKETLCPCCSRPYKWRGLEGFLERRFIALYIFAHRYEIPKLRRAVMICWQTNDEIAQSIPDHSNVIAAYEGLPSSSPLCRYFLDMYMVFWNPDKDSERMIPLRSQLPQAFLFELVTVLAKGDRPKMEREWCDFHEHEDEAETKACQEELGKDPAGAKAIKRLRDSKGWKGLVLKKGKR